ncbi:amino acid/amide ABC transporter ATP-binding protein 2, HAAT family [Paracoccus thiocyanatus]|uniref:Amino acid/amide ABC transporter ATP-binding protein 2, HAAT family n=1 Tax=Paracoccus thiocyanatus TaxID=34006 RepID=A0A1N6XBY7_9RHOB|nr:ABC transporter ATP-binding protein [Paracoccus thiocyanatus]SIQ99741.1 amino acid/amide ABC transporter ATP-binding protein 2, HAAT family [Paracoccus thiocyanatus]
MNAVLRYENLSAFYGASQILHGLSFEVPAASVVCLLGLNGMGKTTTLRATMGLVDRTEGRIMLNGRELAGPTFRRAQMGVTLVPEDRKVFANLTVEENLEVARRPTGSGQDFTIAEAVKIFPRLGERMDQKAGTMSGGEQQMLVVARAMLANPAYMMLDEPTEGLSPSYVGAIAQSIEEARNRGIGVILVEQSIPLALSVGDAFHVVENGQITRSLARDEALADREGLERMLTVE